MSTRSKQSNFINEDINPCLEESKLAQKCLEENMYDGEKCTLYFENYKRCKKFWGFIKKRRRASGTFPALPDKAEREEIKKAWKEGRSLFATERSKNS